MHKSYDLIAFDLDGTLTDPGSGLTKSFAYALGKMGIDYGERTALRRYIGPPLYSEWQKDFGFSDEDADRALAFFHEYFGTKGWCDNLVYPGVPEMLATLRSAGKIVVLATSKPEHYARRILDHFGLTPFFDFAGGADSEKTRDKKWEVLEYALAHFPDIPRDRCLLVGDRMYDIEGARLCGVDSLGVTYGYGSLAELQNAGATAIVDDVGAIAPAILGRS